MSYSTYSDEASADEAMPLCRACVATCNRMTGARATDWVIRADHEKVDGIVRWSMYEAIAAGSETLALCVAQLSLSELRAACASVRCHFVSCPVRRANCRTGAARSAQGASPALPW